MSKYAIQGETITAIADKIRSYVSETFVPSEGTSDTPIALYGVTTYYIEYFDLQDSNYEIGNIDKDTVVAYAYLQNNEGKIVPVLYDTDTNNPNYGDIPDTDEPFFYEGTAEIDGVVYDKWRKIELQDDGQFTWDSVAKQYIYTNVIVNARGEGISPTDFPNKIDEIYEKGYTEGETAGVEEVYAEVEPINAELEQTLYGTDTGGKSYYDEFWDDYLAQAKATKVGASLFAGRGWNAQTFNPPHIIDYITNGYQMFNYAGNIPKEKLALVDFSKITTNFNNIFSYSRITEFPRIDTRGASAISGVFSNASAVTIDALVLKEDGSQTFANVFGNCSALVNLTIEGVIGQNGLNLQWSTKLSKASITSIIMHLSLTTSGMSITLSKTAKEVAFTDTEWADLIATKSNWTINLI